MVSKLVVILLLLATSAFANQCEVCEKEDETVTFYEGWGGGVKLCPDDEGSYLAEIEEAKDDADAKLTTFLEDLRS